MTVYKYKMDYEVGTLLKSPCKECETREDFPKCVDLCKIIERIQQILAETRSSTRGT